MLINIDITDNSSFQGDLEYFEIHPDQAHNPKVTGSSPVPATSKIKPSQKCEGFFYVLGTT